MSLSALSFQRLAAVSLAVGAVFAATAANASTLDFKVKGQGLGLISPCDSGAANCVGLGTVGTANDTGGKASPIPGSWAEFASGNLNTKNGRIKGTWELQDVGPNGNDLHGSFVGRVNQGSGDIGRAVLSFRVAGGDGLFDGATGRGRSVFKFDTDSYKYKQSGSFHVVTAPVPEPETWALMGAGLLAVGVLSRRRRGERKSVDAR